MKWYSGEDTNDFVGSRQAQAAQKNRVEVIFHINSSHSPNCGQRKNKRFVRNRSRCATHEIYERTEQFDRRASQKFNHNPWPLTGCRQQQTVNKAKWILIKIIDFFIASQQMNGADAQGFGSVNREQIFVTLFVNRRFARSDSMPRKIWRFWCWHLEKNF